MLGSIRNKTTNTKTKTSGHDVSFEGGVSPQWCQYINATIQTDQEFTRILLAFTHVNNLTNKNIKRFSVVYLVQYYLVTTKIMNFESKRWVSFRHFSPVIYSKRIVMKIRLMHNENLKQCGSLKTKL